MKCYNTESVMYMTVVAIVVARRSPWYWGISLDLETKTSHTALVLLNSRLAFLRGIIGLRKEHAIVPCGLFGLADAARLYQSKNMISNPIMLFIAAEIIAAYLRLFGLGGLLRLGLGWGWCAFFCTKDKF